MHASTEACRALLAHPLIRRGRGLVESDRNLLPSGCRALDEQIGGWPRGALVEILIPRPGLGELSLVLPSLQAISHEGRVVAWIAPPHLPYAPALSQQGLAMQRQWLLRPTTEDAAWAACTLLHHGSYVLSWAAVPTPTVLRRLQLAAERGGSCGFLFRPESAVRETSPAALRLRIAYDRGLYVSVLKSRHGVRDPGRRIPLPGNDGAGDNAAG